MSYANKLSSFELSFLLRATTAHALRVTIPDVTTTQVYYPPTAGLA